MLEPGLWLARAALIGRSGSGFGYQGPGKQAAMRSGDEGSRFQPGRDETPLPDGRPARDEPRPAHPLSLRTRGRAYGVMMGVCLLLIVLAWTLIWRYSTIAAVIMSAVALVIPPFAVIIANAGPANRQ
jgi:hypothetical protein